MADLSLCCLLILLSYLLSRNVEIVQQLHVLFMRHIVRIHIAVIQLMCYACALGPDGMTLFNISLLKNECIVYI